MLPSFFLKKFLNPRLHPLLHPPIHSHTPLSPLSPLIGCHSRNLQKQQLLHIEMKFINGLIQPPMLTAAESNAKCSDCPSNCWASHDIMHSTCNLTICEMLCEIGYCFSPVRLVLHEFHQNPSMLGSKHDTRRTCFSKKISSNSTRQS